MTLGGRRAGPEWSGGSRLGGYGRGRGALLGRYDVGLRLGKQLSFDLGLATLQGPDPLRVREGHADADFGRGGFLAEPVPLVERIVPGLLEGAEAVLEAGDEPLGISLGQVGGSEQQLDGSVG